MGAAAHGVLGLLDGVHVADADDQSTLHVTIRSGSKTLGKHMPPPAGVKSPALWGTHARLTELFAGADIEATDRARSYFSGYPPSSPSIALLRDGKLL